MTNAPRLRRILKDLGISERMGGAAAARRVPQADEQTTSGESSRGSGEEEDSAGSDAGVAARSASMGGRINRAGRGRRRLVGVGAGATAGPGGAPAPPPVRPPPGRTHTLPAPSSADVHTLPAAGPPLVWPHPGVPCEGRPPEPVGGGVVARSDSVIAAGNVAFSSVVNRDTTKPAQSPSLQPTKSRRKNAPTRAV